MSLRDLMLALITFLALSGCFRTVIPPVVASPELTRLSELGTQRIRVKVSGLPANRSIGHQFLLLFPVNRVRLSDSESFLSVGTTRLLALADITAATESRPDASADAPALRISMEEASLSAYDLLFVRRIAGQVTISGSLRSPNGEILCKEIVTGDAASYERFGFAPELSRTFSQAVDAALESFFTRCNI